jgi:hypothetical protein
LDTSNLLSYITAAKLADGNWKGTAHSFILQWQDKVRLYEKQVPTDELFSGRMKCIMLENAVQPLEELRAIKIQADQHKTQSGVDLTYDQYVNLLTSAASNYDTQFQPKERSGNTSNRRAIYSHDIHDTGIIELDGDRFGIDADLDTIQAFITSQHSPGSRMPFGRWQSVSQSSKDIWDSIPD